MCINKEEIAYTKRWIITKVYYVSEQTLAEQN